jgi:hypothetical protein
MARFGSCCSDLAQVMSGHIEPNLERFGDSLIFENEEGVLVAAVAVQFSEKGTAWWERGINFCPFCGTHLQTLPDRDEKELH